MLDKKSVYHFFTLYTSFSYVMYDHNFFFEPFITDKTSVGEPE